MHQQLADVDRLGVVAAAPQQRDRRRCQMLGDRVVEPEPALLDEPQDRSRRERLRHARDPETGAGIEHGVRAERTVARAPRPPNVRRDDRERDPRVCRVRGRERVRRSRESRLKRRRRARGGRDAREQREHTHQCRDPDAARPREAVDDQPVDANDDSPVASRDQRGKWVPPRAHPAGSEFPGAGPSVAGPASISRRHSSRNAS